MNHWRLLALDLDGTLLTADRTISEENRKWLLKAREHGIEFTFATGRIFPGFVAQYAAELAISLPIITLNGSAVWSPQATLLEQTVLSPTQVDFMFDLANRYARYYWVCTVDQVFDETSFPKVKDRLSFAKFGFVAEDKHTINTIWDALITYGGLEVTNTDPLNIEVNPIGVNKGNALKKVCESLDIDAKDVVTMGDSLNDIAMLRYAGLGIAMENAQQAVKDSATYETARNTEDGVARAIEKLLLG